MKLGNSVLTSQFMRSLFLIKKFQKAKSQLMIKF